MACEEKNQQKMETMQDVINKLTKQTIQLEVERDYHSKINDLEEKVSS
jgi:hypothetical protein